MRTKRIEVEPKGDETPVEAYEREVGFIVRWADGQESLQPPLPLGEPAEEAA